MENILRNITEAYMNGRSIKALDSLFSEDKTTLLINE